MEPEKDSSIFGLSLDFQSSAILKSAASWAKVLAILGFVMGLMIIIIGVRMPATMNAAKSFQGYDETLTAATTKTAATMIMVMYSISGLLFAIGSFLALAFSRKTNQALNANDPVALTSAFANLKNYFIFWTILTLISVFFLLIAVAGILAV